MLLYLILFTSLVILFQLNNFNMWNLYPSSKIIDNRIRQKVSPALIQSYELHQDKLHKMKPKIKIQAPPQPEFVYSKNKL